MKKLIIALILICVFSFNSEGQKNKTYTVDFKNIGFITESQNINLKKRDWVRLSVTNYNPFLYKIEIEGRDSSIPQPVDLGFLSLLASPDKLTGIVSGFSGLIDPAITTTTAPSKQKKDFNLFSLDISDYDPDTKAKAKAKGINRVIGLQNILKEIDSSITVRLYGIETLRMKINDTLYEISELDEVTRKLNPIFKDLTKDDSTIKKTFKSYRANIFQQKMEVGKEFKIYKTKTAPFKDIINANASLKTACTFIDSFYNTSVLVLNEIDTVVSYKTLSEITKTLQIIGQHSSTYHSLPMQLLDDTKKLKLKMSPRDEQTALPSYETEFVVTGIQKKIWGAGAGIFFSGLHNDNYSFKKQGTDTAFSLVADGQGKAQIGVNTMAYFGEQVGKKANYLGPTFGAGFSIEKNIKPRILMGLIYITGESNRVMISAGAVGGQVSVLSSVYDTKDSYKAPVANYQKDMLKVSGFLSINYSFVNK